MSGGLGFGVINIFWVHIPLNNLDRANIQINIQFQTFHKKRFDQFHCQKKIKKQISNKQSKRIL